MVSQVTIGLVEKPVEGSILQLKNIEGIIDSSKNASKGLLLPRVRLLNNYTLKPIVDVNDGITYTGLIVYHISDEDPKCASMEHGLYTWTGSEWVLLGPNSRDLSTEVNIIKDNRDPANPEIYFSRKFGNAGEWMLESIRAKMYDPNRNSTGDAILKVMPTEPAFTSSMTEPFWSYPNLAGEKDASKDAYFLVNQKMGILYNYPAAVNLPMLEDNETETSVVYDKRQGICPYGWYVPSEAEWRLLFDEIMEYTPKYADTNEILKDNYTGTFPLQMDISSNDNRIGNMGLAMKTHCSPEVGSGYGFSKEKGGFAIEYAGANQGDEGSKFSNDRAYLWTSTRDLHSSGIRIFLDRSKEGANLFRLEGDWFFQVRCKKLSTDSVPPSRGVQWLKVNNTNLVNENNELVTLKGVSLGQHRWWPRFYNSKTIEWLKKDFNVNVIRVPIGDMDNSYNFSDNKEDILAKAFLAIDEAIKNDLYVIVDWHTYGLYADQANAFFKEIAKKYKDYPNLLYEICSEPTNVEWDEIKKMSTDMIKSLRDEHVNNIILVGTPNWSTDVDIAAEDPITDYDNIMYTIHFYAATHKKQLRDKADIALNKGIPIFVSESGGMDAAGDGYIDLESWNEWLNWMNSKNISWIAYAVADKDNLCSMVKDESSPDSNWADSDLKEWAILVRKILKK